MDTTLLDADEVKVSRAVLRKALKAFEESLQKLKAEMRDLEFRCSHLRRDGSTADTLLANGASQCAGCGRVTPRSW